MVLCCCFQNFLKHHFAHTSLPSLFSFACFKSEVSSKFSESTPVLFVFIGKLIIAKVLNNVQNMMKKLII